MFEYGLSYALAKISSMMLSVPCIATWITYETCFLKRLYWQNAILFMLLVAAWNSILKFLCGVPLMPPMVGYAIPSGHMHIALAFWGYIAFIYRRNLISKLIFVCLLFFGWSLIKLHYHSLIDIICAYAAFAIELWLIMNKLEQRKYFSLEAISIIILVTYALSMQNMPIYSLTGITALILAQDANQKQLLWILGLWLFCLPGIILEINSINTNIYTFIIIFAAYKISHFWSGRSNEISSHYRS